MEPDILTDSFVLKLSKDINPKEVFPEDLSVYLGFSKAAGACAEIGGHVFSNQRKAVQDLISKYVMKHGKKKEGALKLRKIFLENDMKISADVIKSELQKFDIPVPSDDDTLVDSPVSLPSTPSDTPGEVANAKKEAKAD